MFAKFGQPKYINVFERVIVIYIPKERPGIIYPATIWKIGCKLNPKPVMAYCAPKKTIKTTKKRVAITKPYYGRVDFITYKHTSPTIQLRINMQKYQLLGTSSYSSINL
jgi:hypothetical protein